MTNYGQYNKAYTVTTPQTLVTTGSLEGNIGILSDGTGYSLTLKNGGVVAGTMLDAGIIHELEVQSVTTSGSAVILLYKAFE